MIKKLASLLGLTGLAIGQELLNAKTDAQIEALNQLQNMPAVGYRKDPDDRNKNVQQIVEENGFKFQAYNVTTDDGYINGLHRIVPEKQGAPAILLQHGIEDCAIEWVINSPDMAPAFLLARAGYDVWMGNNRGTIYSQGHVNLNASDSAYWDFDFEEMGLHDVPAFVDFITAKTGHAKVTYVGHSEGTTQMFIGASLMPDYYASKVDLFVALAPVVRMTTL